MRIKPSTLVRAVFSSGSGSNAGFCVPKIEGGGIFAAARARAAPSRHILYTFIVAPVYKNCPPEDTTLTVAGASVTFTMVAAVMWRESLAEGDWNRVADTAMDFAADSAKSGANVITTAFAGSLGNNMR